MIDCDQPDETEMEGAYFVQNGRSIRQVYLQRVPDAVRAADARGPCWRALTRGIPVVALRAHRSDVDHSRHGQI